MKKIEKVFYYIWDLIMQLFKGGINAMTETMFRAVIVYLIPTIITENPAPDWKSFPLVYGIIGIVWIATPIMRL